MVEDQPFFHLRIVNDAIERMAATDTVTIYAGAGVAKDRRSPDWRRLVADLLLLALQGHDEADIAEHSKLLGQIFIDHMTPLMAASAVRFLEEQHPNPEPPSAAISKILYRDRGPTGHLAQGIAWLATMLKLIGRDVMIITTNYDLYIEGARDDRSISYGTEGYDEVIRAITLRPHVDDSEPVSDSEVPVYHLHGVISAPTPRRGAAVDDLGHNYEEDLPRGNITFSEHDYASIRGGWQERLLIERLTKGNVLFVGASLTDPYLSYCLHEALKLIGNGQQATDKETGVDHEQIEKSPWVAVIPLEGEEWWTKTLEAQRKAKEKNQPLVPRSAALKVAQARLGYLGVQALFADYYSQVGQFCWEVLNCISQQPGSYEHDDSPHRYGHRLARWWNEWDYANRKARPIEESQQAMRKDLFEAKEEIAKRLPDRDDREQFKVELWVRRLPTPDGESRELVYWASSQAVMRDESTLHSASIQHESPYIAVQTFAEGRCIGPPLSDEAERLAMGRRWKSYISVPIWLDDAPWYHLPVGSIALMAAPPLGSRSVLATLNSKNRNSIANMLRDVGLALLKV